MAGLSLSRCGRVIVTEQDITIRNAVYLDIRRMMEIEKSATGLFSTLPIEFLQKLPEEIPPQSESFYQSIIQLDMSWVLCVRKEVVGYICTEKMVNQNTLHIHEIDVARPFQGMGLGSKLLRFVIDWARGRHIPRLTLTTFKEVPWNAPFYSKLGFEIMDTNSVDTYLQNLLQAEVRFGLPEETRCAMVLELPES